MQMPAFIAFLEKFHYLNHPYLSGLSALSLFLIGCFVIIKNPKANTHRAFFWMTSAISFWFFGNVASMLYSNKLDLSIFWFRVAYTSVPFISVILYHFCLIQCGKNNRAIFSLYGIAIIEVAYLWLSGDIKTGAYSLPNVGVYWKGLPRFSYFLAFGMVKFTILACASTFVLFREYRKEAIALRKKQLKYITIGFLVVSLGAVEWLVSFGIPLHFAWIVIPPFFCIMAYVIVRYKAMEIDTVIHRTILWILTVFLLILPAAVISLFLKKIIPASYALLNVIATAIYLSIFIAYYNRLRPYIDRLFRRRKYDYQTILGSIAEKIATAINIEALTQDLLGSVCETMYLRNSVLYVLSKDKTKYSAAGMWRQDESQPQNHTEIDPGSPLVKWMSEHRDIMEKEQIEVNPRFEEIKADALAWFKETNVELIVPLIFENKINAFLCLGKKENLHIYTKKDLQLLKKLGKDVGVTVFNALHYEDLIEKERLDEEIKMVREIQMSLLPKDFPQAPGLHISGLMLPATEVGGDYYDFITLPQKDELGIVIGDISGKGVAAGLVMAMTKTVIHTLSREEPSPKQVLLRANEFFNQSVGGQKAMTLLYLIWHAKTNTATYSSAGHEHIFIYRASTNTIEVILSGGILLGMPIDITGYLEEKELALGAGDKILLYTDGVTEAENSLGERFGLERLKESFKSCCAKKVDELIQSIRNDVYGFIGKHPQYDDITLVAMELKGKNY